MKFDPEDGEMIEIIVQAVKSLDFEAQDEIRRRLAIKPSIAGVGHAGHIPESTPYDPSKYVTGWQAFG